MEFSADNMPYHLADTAWSPRRVLPGKYGAPVSWKERFSRQAALRANGFAPLLLDLEAMEHDTDHVHGPLPDKGTTGSGGEVQPHWLPLSRAASIGPCASWP